MRRVFKTKAFARIARKAGIADNALCIAVEEMSQGLNDGSLGQSVFKKRVALGARGKSAGARTIVAMNEGTRWFFLFGYKKNERANVSDMELEALQSIATILLVRSNSDLDMAVAARELEEICNGEDG